MQKLITLKRLGIGVLTAIATVVVSENSSQLVLAQDNVPPPSIETTPEQAPPSMETPPGEAPPSTQEISSEELEQFAQAFQKVRSIEQQSEQSMIQAVEEEGLSPERFIEIGRSQQNPQVEPATEISSEEVENYETARAKLADIQQDTNSQIEQAIQAEGLELSRYNEIIVSLQQNPQLRQELQQMIQQ